MATNLLDQIFSGNSGQALGLLGAGMMSGNAPQGFASAMNMLGPDKELERQLRKAQIDNFNSEVAQRAAATQKLSEGLGMLKGILGGGGTPAYQSGQLGSGTMDVVPNANPTAPAPRSAGGLANATPNDIALLKAYTGVDLTEPWKIAKQGFEQKPGMYRIDPTTNQMTYVMNPVDGRTVDASGRIGLAPGAADATAATTFATELPKAIATSMGTVNLRKNADGTESPVVGINENPVLQSVMDRYFGGGPKLGAPTAAPVNAAPAVPTTAPNLNPAGDHPVISPDDQKAADAESIRMIQSELSNPNLPPDQKAGLQREIARLTASQSQPGFPTPSIAGTNTAPGQGYGMTNDQQNAEASRKAFLEGRAKSMNTYEDGLNGRVSQGGELNMRLQEQLAALNKFKAGGGGETRAQLAQLAQAIPGIPASVVSGIAGGDLAAMQEFNKLAAQTAMEQLKQSMGGAGRISQYEFKIFQNNNPNLSTDPNAIRKIFDFNTRLYNRDLQEQQAFNQHVASGADPASFPSKWAQQLASDGYTKLNMDAQNKAPTKPILRTGVLNGRKVIQYKDGTTSYAD
jgi:hypothetical protein